MPNTRPNPYVGPRSFRTGERMYGRERETLELLDLIIAERIVLLYSPSGAGKTSLIQAALLPKLQEEGFQVTRPIRVSAEAPVQPERKASASGNRFVLSALLSLEEPLPQEKRMPVPTLARMTVDEYLQQRVDMASASPVLVFDQFEEVLTLDPTNLAAKMEFFEQIGKALQDRSRWALFSMREDYLAGLDPYLLPIPTRFGTTYRLDLLGIAAAREAIQKPPLTAGVDFTEAAAKKLIDDLRRVQVQRPDGSMELQPGPYVEPVQMQVVCFRLWDKLPDTQTQILESDLQQVGDVNSALADYYETTVGKTAVATGESERTLREWFDRQLITEQGIRGQVLMEPEQSRGLKNTAIWKLVDAHLVRADERRGATWYELAHDRLIEPVRQNNAAWFQKNLSALQQAADLWLKQGRADDLLLRGKALSDAEAWAQQHANELTATEQEFLKECREAQAARDKEKRQQQRIRYLAIGASVLSALALVAFVVAVIQSRAASAAEQDARNAEATAVANEQDAEQQRARVVTQDRVSKMISSSLAQLQVDPEVGLLLAMEAYSTTQTVETDDALRQAVIESHIRGTLQGHTDSIDTVSISRDGKFFATGSGDSKAILWDAATGKQVRVLSGHEGAIWTVAFSPDGTTLLTTSADATARLWDLTACNDTTCPSRELIGHTKEVWSGAFSQNGDAVVTVGEDGIAKLWETASGTFLGDIGTHTLGINAVAFSPDGHYLATASSDGTAQITDLTTCENTTCTFQTYETQAALWNVAFSPDSQYIILGSDDQNAYVVNIATNSAEYQLSGHSDGVLGVAISPDGEYFATGSRDGTARVWDVGSGQTIAILRGHGDSVWSVAFTPDSRLLLTGSADTTARLWDVSDRAALRVLRGSFNKVFGADYSGDGKRVISVGADSIARVWDLETDAVIANLGGHTGWLSDGALTHDGARAATASFDNTARIWEVAGCAADSASPDCKFIELTGHEGYVRSVTFSPDEKYVLTASDDGTARLWDAATGTQIRIFGGHNGTVTHAFFSSDGNRIITASNDQSAAVWDTATGEPTVVLTGHAGPVNNATFNNDATLVVTASDDRTARIWNIVNCPLEGSNVVCPFQELKGHLGAVTGAVFTRDGNYVVTSSADQTARVWDTKTDQTVSILRGHTDKVQTVELDPDDQFVLTASSDKTVRIVPLSIQTVLDIARTRVTRTLTCDEWFTNVRDPNYCPESAAPQNANALPTLAPVTRVAVQTATATSEPLPTETPSETAEPTTGPVPIFTAVEPAATPLSLPTLPIAATASPATPTPDIAPGVYVTRIVFVPLDAPNFQFKLTFLNNTGAPVTYPKWVVPFFEPGARNSLGAPKGVELTIPVGTSEQLTEPWKVGVGQCSPFVANPVFEDGDGRQTPFPLTDGQPATFDFQLCPS